VVFLARGRKFWFYTTMLLLLVGPLAGCKYVEVPQYRTQHKLEQRTTKVRHYDQHGRYKGYSIIGPYNTRHYDKDGRFTGTSK
jgi:hypothetical protein